MSYLVTNALTNAIAVPSLALKLASFRAFVEEVCRNHDITYAVTTYADEAVTDATSRKQRLAVMGDPARYVEVLYTGDIGRWESETDVRHAVNVFLYHGVGSGTRAAAGDVFRAVLESRSVTEPGLLHAIRAQGEIAIAGDEPGLTGTGITEALALAGTPITMSAPEQVRAVLAYPENHPQDVQYEAAFTLTLT